MKRLLWVCILAVLVLPGGAAAQQDVEQQLKDLVQEWVAAEGRGDSAALKRLIADDFIGMAPGGNTVTKDDITNREPPADPSASPWTAAKFSPLTVRLIGETGFVMGRVDGKDGLSLRFTQVFLKRAGRWQMVAAHLQRVTSQ